MFRGTLLIPIVACGLTEGATKFKYVDKSDLKSDPLYLENKTDYKEPSHYGALKYQEDHMEGNEGDLYILQRRKGVYQAETMFKQTNDKKLTQAKQCYKNHTTTNYNKLNNNYKPTNPELTHNNKSTKREPTNNKQSTKNELIVTKCQQQLN